MRGGCRSPAAWPDGHRTESQPPQDGAGPWFIGDVGSCGEKSVAAVRRMSAHDPKLSVVVNQSYGRIVDKSVFETEGAGSLHPTQTEVVKPGKKTFNVERHSATRLYREAKFGQSVQNHGQSY